MLVRDLMVSWFYLKKKSLKREPKKSPRTPIRVGQTIQYEFREKLHMRMENPQKQLSLDFSGSAIKFDKNISILGNTKLRVDDSIIQPRTQILVRSR